MCKVAPKNITPSPQTERINGEIFEIRCESGLTVKCNKIFWVTQASAPEWLKIAGLGTEEIRESGAGRAGEWSSKTH